MLALNDTGADVRRVFNEGAAVHPCHSEKSDLWGEKDTKRKHDQSKQCRGPNGEGHGANNVAQ